MSCPKPSMLTAFPKVTVFVYEYLVSYFSATLVFNEILSVAVLVLSPEYDIVRENVSEVAPANAILFSSSFANVIEALYVILSSDCCLSI